MSTYLQSFCPVIGAALQQQLLEGGCCHKLALLNPLGHHIGQLDCRRWRQGDWPCSRRLRPPLERVARAACIPQCCLCMLQAVENQQAKRRGTGEQSERAPVTFSPARSAMDCRVLPNQPAPMLLPPLPPPAAASSSAADASDWRLAASDRAAAEEEGVGAGACSAADSTSSTVSSTTCNDGLSKARCGSVLTTGAGRSGGLKPALAWRCRGDAGAPSAYACAAPCMPSSHTPPPQGPRMGTSTRRTPAHLDWLRGQRRPRDGDGQAAGKGAPHVRQRRGGTQQRRQVQLQVVQGEHAAAAEGDLQRARLRPRRVARRPAVGGEQVPVEAPSPRLGWQSSGGACSCSTAQAAAAGPGGAAMPARWLKAQPTGRKRTRCRCPADATVDVLAQHPP